ncbi:MAG: phosphoesterase [Bdellovibrionales bacterium RIFOXYB2_FULL_36_6]|nr:MAG: phosphoesterase [Bdellovibrionales bacterium RIFOXYB2_FULL_36_6]
MTGSETVLCIKRDVLPISWLRNKSVVPLSLDIFIENCSNAGFEFLNRKAVEKDTAYKQIIPYIVLQTRDMKKIALYNRQGSEKRLHDLWSIGIGGHINPIDRDEQNASFQQILMAGMERELNEELCQRPANERPEFIGVISEDITDVGKVHLGAVFRIFTEYPEKYLPGSELFQFGWQDMKLLDKLTMELWSTLALNLLSYH